MTEKYNERVSLIGGLLMLMKSRKGWAFILTLIASALWQVMGWDTEALILILPTALGYIGLQGWVDKEEAKRMTETSIELVSDVLEAGHELQDKWHG